MMTIFSKKNEIKQKKEILRGLYEENLKILGKGGARIYKQRPFYLRRMSLSFYLAIAAVLLHGIFFNTAFFPEKELTASIISPNAPEMTVKAP
jgi:hypothetical protein